MAQSPPPPSPCRSYHSDCTVSANATVAICYSGEIRALDVIYESVVTATTRIVAASFFVLDAMPCVDQMGSQQDAQHADDCVRSRGLSARAGTGWSNLSDGAARALVGRYCAVHWSYQPPVAASALQLCHGDAQQYWKVQRVYAMVRHFEQRRGVPFEWLIRMRTDVYFFGTLPPLGSLSRHHIHAPMGMVNPGTDFNDHLAVVPRQLAAAYFDAADDLSCNASLHTPGQRGRLQSHPMTFLQDRLRSHGVAMAQFELRYVLLRSGSDLEPTQLTSACSKTIRTRRHY